MYIMHISCHNTNRKLLSKGHDLSQPRVVEQNGKFLLFMGHSR